MCVAGHLGDAAVSSFGYTGDSSGVSLLMLAVVTVKQHVCFDAKEIIARFLQ